VQFITKGPDIPDALRQAHEAAHSLHHVKEELKTVVIL
jgi:hypothetical protein